MPKMTAIPNGCILIDAPKFPFIAKKTLLVIPHEGQLMPVVLENTHGIFGMKPKKPDAKNAAPRAKMAVYVI